MSASWVVKTPSDVLGSLSEIEQRHAPRELYLRGDGALLEEGPRVSVIGARAASEDGLRRARSLARALVEHDIVVVSGLAAGIDTAAHIGAMDTGGRTIAVLGTPIDQVYPWQNADLQQRIAEHHLLVSQFALGTAVSPQNFPTRNRTMALLSHATIIVEAAEKSGTVGQGWEALRLGRRLFLLESVATNTELTWPAKMMAEGGQVLTRSNLHASLSSIVAVAACER